MASQHTQVKLEAIGSIVRTSLSNSGYLVAELRDAHGLTHTEEAKANARLFSVSGDLLIVAEMVMKWWEEHQYDTTGERGDYNVYNEDPDFVRYAREAISKVEGSAL